MQTARILAVLALFYFGPMVMFWPTECSHSAAAQSTATASDIASASHAIELADEQEPGERMRVDGVLFAADGTTPLPHTEIYVYHTDIRGYYSGETTRSDNPRIHGTLITDEAGRYELRTIRPGPYPEAGVPAHVHYVVRPQGNSEQRFELNFAGDPLLSPRQVERSSKAGRFGSVKTTAKDAQGVWRVEHDLRLSASR